MEFQWSWERWGINPELHGRIFYSDLKAAGTIVTKKTIGNTIRREALKSCSARKVPLLKKAHVQACQKFANDSEENWVKVLWSDETKIELFGINSTRRVWRRRNAAYGHQGQGIEASQGIENGSWMGIPAWQWPKTHGQGNNGVAKEAH